MRVINTGFAGLIIIEPDINADRQGHDCLFYNQTEIEKYIGEITFVQDNESCSHKGVIRAFHYQEGIYAQAKLVRVAFGEVQDVVIDLRKESKTYRKSFSIILSSDNHRMLYVPRGFAHGICALRENTVLQFKCDNYYNKEAERAIPWNDPFYAIKWILKPSTHNLTKETKNIKK